MLNWVTNHAACLVLWSVVLVLWTPAFSAQSASPGAADAVTGVSGSTRDSSPPDAISDLVATRSMPDVILSWTAPSDDVGVTSFRVYQHDAASGTCTQIAHILNEAAQTYTVHCVCGNPTINFLYDVRAEDAAGNIANPSNLVGEFDYMGQEGPIGPVIVSTPTCLTVLVQRGSVAFDTLRVTNAGDGVLTVSSVTGSEAWLTGEFPTALPVNINPGTSGVLTVSVDADTLTAGAYEPALSIESNAPDSRSLGVGISVRVPLVEMMAIPGGTFQMGSNSSWGYPDETPVHEVTVRAFHMSKYEVTQAQYEAVMGTDPSYFSGDDRPVERVSWYDAARFCNALSQSEGLTPCYNESNWSCNFSANGYRLPTEAEWEYACRAGTTTDLYSGDLTSGEQDPNMDAIGWYYFNSDQGSGRQTHDVGGKQPNSFGLYDMSGNVWEWCNDWYGYPYPSEPQTDPTGPSSGSYLVFRGGSWGMWAQGCRSAYRPYDYPGWLNSYLGLRLARR